MVESWLSQIKGAKFTWTKCPNVFVLSCSEEIINQNQKIEQSVIDHLEKSGPDT